MIHSYILCMHIFLGTLSFFFPCPSNFIILLYFVEFSHCDGRGWLPIRFVY